MHKLSVSIYPVAQAVQTPVYTLHPAEVQLSGQAKEQYPLTNPYPVLHVVQRLELLQVKQLLIEQRTQTVLLRFV